MCNAIVGNFSYVKRPTAGAGTDATISVRAAASASAARAASRRVASSHSARSLFDSFEMRCRKARSTRGQCESNIGKQFFSGKNFSAAFQDFRTLLVRAVWHPPSHLPLLRQPLFSILLAASVLPLSCSASVVPAHFLRTTFKPRSFLAIKECPRSFARDLQPCR